MLHFGPPLLPRKKTVTLCSLSIVYTCPYHNLTATMGLFTKLSANRSATRHHTCGLRLWGRLAVLPHSLKQRWKRLMVERCTFNSLATALVDIPAVSMPIARSLNLRHLELCCVTKLHILEWPFIVPSTRCTCVMIMPLLHSQARRGN